MGNTTDEGWGGWLDPETWARWLDGGVDGGWGAWVADAAGFRGPRQSLPEITDPDAFAARRTAESRRDGAWETAVERLVRHGPGRTPWSIVFLHGFGACRAGGELVVDDIAEEMGANVWYPLLPGHGRTPEAHAAAPAEAYLGVAAEALAMGRALGDRVLLIGSSTGGLLATWLAATWPEHVAAVALASPLYAFSDPTALVLRLPWGADAVIATRGETRDASFGEDPTGRRVEGYEQRWLTEQRYTALAPLERLRGWLAREDVYRRVRAPVLLLYTPHDDVVSVDAMHHAFGTMPPHPQSRFAPIEDGHHVLLSEWVRTDKERIGRALRTFLKDVGALER